MNVSCCQIWYLLISSPLVSSHMIPVSLSSARITAGHHTSSIVTTGPHKTSILIIDQYNLYNYYMSICNRFGLVSNSCVLRPLCLYNDYQFTTTSEYTTGMITTSQYTTGMITTGQYATSTVTTGWYTTGTVTTSRYTTGTVTMGMTGPHYTSIHIIGQWYLTVMVTTGQYATGMGMTGPHYTGIHISSQYYLHDYYLSIFHCQYSTDLVYYTQASTIILVS